MFPSVKLTTVLFNATYVKDLLPHYDIALHISTEK